MRDDARALVEPLRLAGKREGFLTAAGLPDAELRYRADYLESDAADGLFASLLSLPDWQQSRIRLFGREHLEPRLTAWFADPGVDYRYSGRDCRARPWPPALASLRDRLAVDCGVRFNGLLSNLYRDGDDAMGWHSDDERALGPRPVIASISLGATRDFLLRRRDDHRRRVSLSLTHGSLLLMAGETQRHWQHALPRRRRVRSARINLTFRHVLAG